MNKEQDYATDSDESDDEDFCPENASEADSGDDDDNEEEEDEEQSASEAEEGETKTTKTKGKKKDKTKQKRGETSSIAARSTRQTEAKHNERVAAAAEKDELESDEEADKSRSDALWADFLGDVGAVDTKKKTPTKAKEASKPPAPAKPAEVLEFAGEPVTIEKTVNVTVTGSDSSSSSSAKENQEEQPKEAAAASIPRSFLAKKRPVNGTGSGGGGGGGLGSLLNQLGKKKKLSVLEKSQMDWKSFKSDEGIDEELRTHNKGKDGYLERQDFLQRTDLRQFEIEKSLRQTRRQN